MCTSPITVKNPIKRFVPIVDKPKLIVPCGKCWECRSRKRNDYFIRSFFEYLHTQHSGGFSYFQTLTYDNYNLPLFAFYDRFTGRKIVTSVFNKKDIRLYLDRCKSALRRKFGSQLVNNNVRYILTCEYGSDSDYIDNHGKLRHATHRPHYHLIWFVSSPINRWQFRDIVLNAWTCGLTYDSDTNNGFIQGLGAIKYVSKYVSKDIDVMLHDSTLLNRVPDKMKADFIKVASPFIRVSSGHKDKGILSFGEYALTKKNGKYVCSQYVNDQLLFDGYILAPDKDCGVKKYPLPLFYDRLLHYDKFIDVWSDENGKHYSGLYYLNDAGRKMKLHRLEHQAQAVKKRIQQINCYTPANEKDFIEQINNKTLKDFNTFEDVRTYINQFNINKTNDYLYAYVVYRGYDLYTDNHSYISDIMPVEDYKEILTFDRNKHSLEDFSPSGIQYKDLFYDVQQHSNQFNYANDFISTVNHVFDYIVNYFGTVKDTKQIQIEKDCERRNKYLKQHKKLKCYGKNNSYTPVHCNDEQYFVLS